MTADCHLSLNCKLDEPTDSKRSTPSGDRSREFVSGRSPLGIQPYAADAALVANRYSPFAARAFAC